LVNIDENILLVYTEKIIIRKEGVKKKKKPN